MLLYYLEIFTDLEVLKTPLRHILKTSYEGEFSVTIYHLARRLQDIL